MAKDFVISVGGSLLVPPAGINSQFLKKFSALILSRAKRGDRFFLVVGGGRTARNYIAAAKQAGKMSSAAGDWLGIAATRLNAQLLKTAFDFAAHPEIIIDPTKPIWTRKKIILAAGYKPGWSTDYVAVLLAKHNNIATIINLSNVDYAYNKDPNRYPDAQKLEKASWLEFQRIIGGVWRPGLNSPFDPVASKEASRQKIKVIIMGGDLKNLAACLRGRPFKGTTIS